MTPATQNNLTSCVETFEKERFCSFPHRHGINEATTTRPRRDGDPTSNWRQTRVQPPDPQIINGNPSLRIRAKRRQQEEGERTGDTLGKTRCVQQSLRKGLPSTTLYYKACRNTEHFPVLLCTTKLAQSTSQYYFVLQSLHKAFSVLLCTTKPAQNTSQYYFVLESLHKVLPSTTVYYKACKKHVPVILCTTKLAQSTSLYYFVLQSLHKALPSTTLYYKACTEHFPVLLCTTKLAQSNSQYDFVLQSWHKTLPSTTAMFCSFPHRHSDVSASKQARLCSFPHRHGDARGQAETRDETEVVQLPP